MITRLDRYQTRDGVVHNTSAKAISHCLEKAHLSLIEILKNANVEQPYRVAQRIVSRLYETKNADSLLNIAAYIKDVITDLEE